MRAAPTIAAPERAEADRDDERRAFLAAAGEGGCTLVALPADASPRRYFRLEGAGQMLMDATPGAADLPPFLAVAAHLGRLGLSAPRVIAADAARGLALIEDLGDGTFTRLIAGGHDERALYALAVDALVTLHRAPEGTAIAVPAYDAAALEAETALFADWYVPAVAPALAADPARLARFRRDFLAAFDAALADVAARREALVLRDFHVDNLMVVDGRTGVAACGLLDFQDALVGARAYDLVSLTEDARRDLAPGLAEAMVDRYLAAMPEIDRDRFQADCALLAAQRHAKVAGIFERLARRDGKTRYRAHIPRVVGLLDRALARAGLGEIADLVDAHAPGWRIYPPAVQAHPEHTP